ncbi:Fic family protein [Prosthecobacter debontii]|uniref:Fic family protein n=1 Tax=Prosthecobacter debontii TaxID=48467 RepID=A0A1T4XZA4_9BACT|nr:Fic family protein [Prosthecobacter debontii]SKA94894.1 Fic family protein [Prosthecobacter debontii]
MRKYEQTHPWLKFHIRLWEIGHEFWLHLGEAVSKCEHLSKVPLRPATAQLLHQVYMAKGAAATTAIEGNTLSEEEVLRAVEGRLEVAPSREYLKQEVDNVIAAFMRISSQISSQTLPPLSVSLMKQFNAQVLQDVPKEEWVVPGEYRDRSVIVGRVYRGAPAEDCDYLMDRLCEWLNGPDFALSKPGMEMVSAIIKAVLAHVYLAWIHPFGDGNGRTARLVEFYLLMSAGMPAPAAHLMSNHYNQTKEEYYRQLDHASKSGGDLMPFLCYAVRGLVDGLRGQLEYVWTQQWDMTWRNHVHELFQNRTRPGDVRQRHLALDLGQKNDWVELSQVDELTPRLAKAYATKTTKTLQRDLAELEEMGLIVREGRKVRAKRELIFAFLPLRHRSEVDV